MLTLQTPLAKALRTTQFHLRRLKSLGIETVSDFLLYFPCRYTDQRNLAPILEIRPDTVNIVRGRIKSIQNTSTWRRKMTLTTALLSDSAGSVECVWFNQSYVAKTLRQGDEIIISGKARYNSKKGKIHFQNPTYEFIKREQIHTARIVPIYHETKLDAPRRVRGKISSKWVREKLFSLLPFAEYFTDYLPQEIKTANKLMNLAEAVKNVHFPQSEKILAQAQKRLAFDELFLLQLAAMHRRSMWRKIAQNEKKQIPADWGVIRKFVQSLPWSLTAAQKKAIYEIVKDMEKPFPMSRLLEGDTGSGKTVVAAAAAYSAITAGFQACLLAPTEILAEQHHKSFQKLLAPFNIAPELMLGAFTKKEKNSIAEKLKTGEIKIVIGTHALIQENIGFKNLGLAVIDEQHRFGVRQRETVKMFGSPHFLSLTATPIPRTLALIIYGDQDLSVLDEMPLGRKKTVTRIVPEQKRQKAYEWIKKEIERGRQAFIIFPLIEESEVLQIKAAVSEHEKLQNEIFPELMVGLLHGQMKSEDRERAMKAFKEKRLDILVSTSVVEVGVDIPNVTIMMIEGAERFGLAQLHQFRGRVGRGSEQSYCLLFPTSTTPQNLKRLLALVKFNSGFKLAEVDLQLRGPGEVYGTAQSGVPDLKMANLTDALTIKQSRDAAQLIIEKDPELNQHPNLKEKIIEQENIAIDY